MAAPQHLGPGQTLGLGLKRAPVPSSYTARTTPSRVVSTGVLAMPTHQITPPRPCSLDQDTLRRLEALVAADVDCQQAVWEGCDGPEAHMAPTMTEVEALAASLRATATPAEAGVPGAPGTGTPSDHSACEAQPSTLPAVQPRTHRRRRIEQPSTESWQQGALHQPTLHAAGSQALHLEVGKQGSPELSAPGQTHQPCSSQLHLQQHSEHLSSAGVGLRAAAVARRRQHQQQHRSPQHLTSAPTEVHSSGSPDNRQHTEAGLPSQDPPSSGPGTSRRKRRAAVQQAGSTGGMNPSLVHSTRPKSSRQRITPAKAAIPSHITDAALTAPVGKFVGLSGTRAKVLTRSQERELAVKCQDLMALQSARRQLGQVLRRQPTLLELATALKIHPQELSQRLSTGTAAKRTLVQRNLGMVLKTAQGIYQSKVVSSGRSMAFHDVVEEGVQGLLKALEKFDPNAGYKLSTYAVPWIKQHILRAVQLEAAMIRVPAFVHEDISKYRMTKKTMAMELGRQPTAEELTQRLKWTTKRLNQATEAAKLDMQAGAHVSLDLADDPDDVYSETLVAAMSTATQQEGDGSGTLSGSMSQGVHQAPNRDDDHANRWQLLHVLTTVLEECLPRTARRGVLREAMILLFKWKLGLEVEGSEFGSAGGQGEHGAGRGRMGRPTPAFGYRAVAQMSGWSHERLRQLEKAVYLRVQQHHAEEVMLLLAASTKGASGTVARSTAGAHKKK